MSTIQEAIKALNEGKICFCENTKYYWKMENGILKWAINIEFTFQYNRNEGCNEFFTISEILSQWKIIENKFDLKPCIFCGIKVHFKRVDEIEKIFVECSNENCLYNSPLYSSFKECMEAHNDIYEKIKRE